MMCAPSSAVRCVRCDGVLRAGQGQPVGPPHGHGRLRDLGGDPLVRHHLTARGPDGRRERHRPQVFPHDQRGGAARWHALPESPDVLTVQQATDHSLDRLERHQVIGVEIVQLH